MTPKKLPEGIYRRGRMLWLKVRDENGGYVQQSAKTEDVAEAVRMRDQLRAQAGRGELGQAVKMNSILIEELQRDDLERMERECDAATVKWAGARWKLYLAPYFGHLTAAELTTDRLESYRTNRLAAGAAKSTINNEMSLLRTALYTGFRRTPPKVARIIQVPMFPASQLTVRDGFLDLEEYGKLLGLVEPSIKTLIVVLYHLGLRKMEAVNLQWSQVEFAVAGRPGLIRLRPLETKNNEPRTCPLYGDLEPYLRWQRQVRDAVCPTSPYVFFWMPDARVMGGQEGGMRIVPGAPMGGEGRHFKAPQSWTESVAAIGRPELVMHDMRRSAVRNMIEIAGMSAKQAMVFSGHKTMSMIERYHILGKGEIESARAKLQDMYDRHKGMLPPTPTLSQAAYQDALAPCVEKPKVIEFARRGSRVG